VEGLADRQIAVEGRGGDPLGGYVQGVYALAPEADEGRLAVAQQVAQGEAPVGRVRPPEARGDRRQLREDRIADRHEQQLVAPGQQGERPHAARLRPDEVREDHDQGALALTHRQLPCERREVRLHRTGLERPEKFQEGAEAAPVGAGSDDATNLAVEDHHGDPVAGHQPGVGEDQRRVHRVVELAAPVDLRRHQPAPVEDHAEHVVALVLVLSHHGPSPASRGGPVDAPRVVSRHVVPHGLELEPFAPPRRRPGPDPLEHTSRIQGLPAQQQARVGMDPKDVIGAAPDAPAQEAERRAGEGDRAAQGAIAAAPGPHPVGRHRVLARRHLQVEALPGRLQVLGHRLPQRDGEGPTARIAHRHLDGEVSAHVGPGRQAAGDLVGRIPTRPQPVGHGGEDEGGGQETQGEVGHRQPERGEAGRDPQRGGGQEPRGGAPGHRGTGQASRVASRTASGVSPSTSAAGSSWMR